MVGFPKTERQRIIDGYLSETRRNLFHPAEFVDWLSERPDHEAYDWFFGQGDTEAARQHRIGMARHMASGLRITAPVSKAPNKSKPVTVEVREFPALVSPVLGRKDGGGYVAFDPEDWDMVLELQRQGAQSLRSWLNRYRGVAEQTGVDLAPIEKIAVQLDGSVAGAA